MRANNLRSNKPNNPDEKKATLISALLVTSFTGTIANLSSGTDPELATAAVLTGGLILLALALVALGTRARDREQQVYAVAQTEFLDRFHAEISRSAIPKASPYFQEGEVPTSINLQQLEELLARYDEIESSRLASTENPIAAVA